MQEIEFTKEDEYCIRNFGYNEVKDYEDLKQLEDEKHLIFEELEYRLQQKENIIKEVREYIEKDTRWFDSEYAKTYGQLCTCAGANNTRLEVLVNPSNLLEILDKENI